jgi:hypothetical protein
MIFNQHDLGLPYAGGLGVAIGNFMRATPQIHIGAPHGPREQFARGPRSPRSNAPVRRTMAFDHIYCWWAEGIIARVLHESARKQRVSFAAFHRCADRPLGPRSCQTVAIYPEFGGATVTSVQLEILGGGEGGSRSLVQTAALLKPLGYRTHALGKWDVGFRPGPPGAVKKPERFP